MNKIDGIERDRQLSGVKRLVRAHLRDDIADPASRFVNLSHMLGQACLRRPRFGNAFGHILAPAEDDLEGVRNVVAEQVDEVLVLVLPVAKGTTLLTKSTESTSLLLGYTEADDERDRGRQDDRQDLEEEDVDVGELVERDWPRCLHHLGQQHHQCGNSRHDRPDTGPRHVDRDEHERAHPQEIGPEREGRHYVLNRNDDHRDCDEDADRNLEHAEPGIAEEKQREHRTAAEIHGARERLLGEDAEDAERGENRLRRKQKGDEETLVLDLIGVDERRTSIAKSIDH